MAKSEINNSGVAPSGPNNPQQATKDDYTNAAHNIYEPNQKNWYTAKPYGFKMNTKADGTFIMFLPISPSNLTIQTKFATNLIPTLYGTVEEHSDVRYYEISIEGTTGMAPQYAFPSAGPNTDTPKLDGRSSFSVASAFNIGAFGFAAKTFGTINKILNKATDILSPLKSQTGLFTDQTGYAAFHSLYRFLLLHKKDASGAITGKEPFAATTGTRNEHPLKFFNYKDNNEYSVVVRNFTMRRSADNPMLYYYSIQLTGYDMKTIGSTVKEDLTDRMTAYGINGVDSSSVFAKMKKIASVGRSIVSGTLGGIKILGR